MAISLSLVGCDSFPAKEIYISDLIGKTCAEVKIIKENPLEFGEASFVDPSNCNVIYGFKEQNIGDVTDWIRRNQNKIKN
jgi:hypothetical protein